MSPACSVYLMSRQHTRNILRAYRAATPIDREEGLAWYREAHEFALSLDPDNVERAAGVIAAISPMMYWSYNQRLASEIYAGRREQGCLPDNMAKALRIMDGEHPLNVLGGEKVLSFYHNILLDNVRVTIDRHAIDIACGKPQSDADRAPYFKGKRRKELVQSYTNAARIEGVLPYEIQAITWVYWRKAKRG